jgi:hypothetical protein
MEERECVCVCVWERGREGERERVFPVVLPLHFSLLFLKLCNVYCCQSVLLALSQSVIYWQGEGRMEGKDECQSFLVVDNFAFWTGSSMFSFRKLCRKSDQRTGRGGGVFVWERERGAVFSRCYILFVIPLYLWYMAVMEEGVMEGKNTKVNEKKVSGSFTASLTLRNKKIHRPFVPCCQKGFTLGVDHTEQATIIYVLCLSHPLSHSLPLRLSPSLPLPLCLSLSFCLSPPLFYFIPFRLISLIIPFFCVFRKDKIANIIPCVLLWILCVYRALFVFLVNQRDR